MNRDQRIQDNWAFLYAQEIALRKKEPLLILFCLLHKFKVATFRAYKFMMEGLKEMQPQLEELNILFIMELGNPDTILPQFIEKYNIGALITDFSPLRIKREWLKKISNRISIPFYEVDAHNIVPVWEATSKKEYPAYSYLKCGQMWTFVT